MTDVTRAWSKAKLADVCGWCERAIHPGDWVAYGHDGALCCRACLEDDDDR